MKLRPEALEHARNTLVSVRALFPTASEVDELEPMAAAARTRGYLLPDEEEALRFLVDRYLHARVALHQTIREMRPYVSRFRVPSDEDSRKAFLCAWLSGCILMRAARYVSRRYAKDPLVWKALNQADPIRGIPAGLFDTIRASSVRPRVLARYFRALRYAAELEPCWRKLEEDPEWAPLVKALQEEANFLETQKRAHAESYASTQWSRWRNKPVQRYRRVMFGMFEISGRAIAEMRNPLHRKRVGAQAQNRLRDLIQAGDILITRHDDAMSNLFLPGFWPHAAFVVGTPEERRRLGLQPREESQLRSPEDFCFLEARKDGVRFRRLEDTLSVDTFLLLRPEYPSEEARCAAVKRAMTHEGKLYDFEFDFTRSDRLVCTEVVYRALEGQDPFHFDLIHKAGHLTLPAEDLLRQLLTTKRGQVLLVAGLQGNGIVTGSRAEQLVCRSLGMT